MRSALGMTAELSCCKFTPRQFNKCRDLCLPIASFSLLCLFPCHIIGIAMFRAHRRIVSFVALLSVMLHAYALVGHNAMMLRSSTSTQAATAAQSSIFAQIDLLSIICRANGGYDADGSQSVSGSNQKPGQKHNKGSSSCPVCSGIAMAHAVIPPPLVVVHLLRGYSVIEPSAHVAITHLARAALPPARGPPSLV